LSMSACICAPSARAHTCIADPTSHPVVWYVRARRRVEDFDLHKELYRGKTSLVYMATDKQSGVQVALKLYRKRKLSTMNR